MVSLRAGLISATPTTCWQASIDSKGGTRSTRGKPSIQGLRQLKLSPALCGDRRAAFAAAIDDYCVSYCILQGPVAQKPISAIATFNLKVNQAVYFPTPRCCLTFIIGKALKLEEVNFEK